MATYSIYSKMPMFVFSKLNVYNSVSGMDGRLFLLDDGRITYGNYFTVGTGVDGYLGKGITHDGLFEIATGELFDLVKAYKKELLYGSYVLIEHPNKETTMGKLLSNRDVGLE